MSTIYWITVLGNIKSALGILVVILIAVLFVLVIGYIANFDGGLGVINEKCRKYIKRVSLAIIVAYLPKIFIPSTMELYMIYGIGGTIDYLKGNPTAKQLPDKCIKAIDKWIDSLNKEDKQERR